MGAVQSLKRGHLCFIFYFLLPGGGGGGGGGRMLNCFGDKATSTEQNKKHYSFKEGFGGESSLVKGCWLTGSS